MTFELTRVFLRVISACQLPHASLRRKAAESWERASAHRNERQPRDTLTENATAIDDPSVIYYDNKTCKAFFCLEIFIFLRLSCGLGTSVYRFWVVTTSPAYQHLNGFLRSARPTGCLLISLLLLFPKRGWCEGIYIRMSFTFLVQIG